LDPAGIHLARHLIARQVGVDAKKDLLGLLSLWGVGFTYLFGKCRCWFFHLVRLLLFGSLTSTMASTIQSDCFTVDDRSMGSSTNARWKNTVNKKS
jgi:hypothetical protein